MSSDVLIRLRSPAAPSAGSGFPCRAARSTCATSRRCAARAAEATAGGALTGMPAASPWMPPISELATGALTWSSEARAASTACGHRARCASLARSRSSAGA